MKVDVLVAEVGSTTTVVSAFNGIEDKSVEPEFLGQGQATTSVDEGDVLIGVQAAIEDLKHNLGADNLDYDELFASSSAAGGLKMTVHGLVFDMTARAAKEAALGAGGVLHLVTAGKLRRTDLKKIKESNPNIILIAGGVDYGERDTALDNAEKIAEMGLSIPVIYAGNIENQEEIKLIFEETDQELYLVENVYPKIDSLNPEPTRKVIHDAFEKHIVHAPGMNNIYDMVNGHVIPTPGSVMNVAKLFYKYVGDVVVVDVGGATTDVHSVTDGSKFVNKVTVAPEARAKRTVEGDIGLYVSLDNVINLIGEEELAAEGFDLETIKATYNGIPQTDEEMRLVEKLTEVATKTAIDRHAGRFRYVYGPSGRQTLAEGKDLSTVKYVIGTGGALTNTKNAVDILKGVQRDRHSMQLLPKKEPKVLIDHQYIMSALGVLATKHEKAAAQLLAKSLDFEFLSEAAKKDPEEQENRDKD